MEQIEHQACRSVLNSHNILDDDYIGRYLWPMNYFIARNFEWLPHLEEELCSLFGKRAVRKVADLPIIKVKGSIRYKQVGLSLNALPNTKSFPEGAIKEQSEKIREFVLSELPTANDDIGLNLNVFSISSKFCVLTNGRAEILRDKLHKILRKEGCFVKKKMDLKNCHQLQIMILPSRELKVSLVNKAEIHYYEQLISPYAGGFTKIGDDKKAPSRAFKKLIEAQEVLGKKIQESEVLVDLGACPGGWSYVARMHNAYVVAIDRSEVREDLLKDPKVTFMQRDAFKYRTDMPIDWVVSDIICSPERILELLNIWVHSAYCKNFVFTIKFQGKENYSVLSDFKQFIKDHKQYKIILRQLNVNKNEVTIMGSQI